MARRIVDLHPDDHAARIQLRARLRRIREQQGMSQRDFAPLVDRTQPGVGKYERDGVDQSKTSTIAAWARALGHRLVLTPVGFPRPVRWRRQTNPVSPVDLLLADLIETYDGGAFSGPDVWLAAVTLHHLVGIRVACGVSQEQLGRVLGVSEQCVSLTERNAADNQLATLQRYARAVAGASRHRGGHLAVGLDPIVHDQPQHAVSL